MYVYLLCSFVLYFQLLLQLSVVFGICIVCFQLNIYAFIAITLVETSAGGVLVSDGISRQHEVFRSWYGF